MTKILFQTTCFSCALLLSACVTNDDLMNGAQAFLKQHQSSANNATTTLTSAQMVAGLKDALNVGTNIVVTQLGKQGGFNLDPKIRIPLPDTMKKIDTALAKIGMNSLTSDLENRMNAAAEMAVPQAKELFIASIRQMTFTDAKQILFSGQQDAATQYLRKTMGTELANRVQPIVTSTLQKTGAVQAYDRVLGQYATLPFVSDVKTDMNNYVTQKALDGVFFYVAKEEAAIRENPAKRTTEILRTVFGQVQ